MKIFASELLLRVQLVVFIWVNDLRCSKGSEPDNLIRI